MASLTIKELVGHLAEERGLDLRGYKLSTLERRFRRRMAELRIPSFEQYASYIGERRAEVNELLHAVLINVTRFFRDPQVWEKLRREVLPELCAQQHPGNAFRAWSAGCASGEEAYSIAILLAEQLGPRHRDIDIKVYATDVDDDALDAARKGEYSLEKLRDVPQEWREKYFQAGARVARVSRELRKLVIFGRGNLTCHAPISRVRLLLCRNMLIYFDSELQARILKRLHYALEPGGVLVLGKAESQLSQNSLFRPLSSKWRIFERLDTAAQPRDRAARSRPREEAVVEKNSEKTSEESELLKLYHDTVLATVEPGVLILDTRDVIITDNEQASRLLDLPVGKFAGKHVSETPLYARCPDLAARIESSRNAPGEKFRFECAIGPEEAKRTTAVTVKAIITPKGGRAGTLIYVEDVTTHHRLQSTIVELETTGEELQSTNEELETTNEELQSANEELETTNEELQSANEELGTTNEELEVRTHELDEMNNRYAETLGRIPWPVLLVGRNSTLQFWNEAAAHLFGLESNSVVGLAMTQLPLPEKLRQLLARSEHEVAASRRSKVLRNRTLELRTFRGTADIHCTPLGETETWPMVLILFEPHQDRHLPTNTRAPRDGAAKESPPKRKTAKRRPK